MALNPGRCPSGAYGMALPTLGCLSGADGMALNPLGSSPGTDGMALNTRDTLPGIGSEASPPVRRTTQLAGNSYKQGGHPR